MEGGGGGGGGGGDQHTRAPKGKEHFLFYGNDGS